MNTFISPLRLVFLVAILGLICSGSMGQEWTIVEASGEVNARRDNGFMSCRGKFYLLGGRGIHPVDIFDPSEGTWSQGAPPPVEMHHFQAVRMKDEIWVLGAFTGESPNEKPLEHIYIYDTASDQWRRGDPMPRERLRGSAGVAVYRERIYLLGGVTNMQKSKSCSWVDRYDPKKGKWKKLADAPRARGHFHAGICKGIIYAAGGNSPSGDMDDHSGNLIADVDMYEIESGKWASLPTELSLPTPRAACATVNILDHIVVIGGESPDQVNAHTRVEAYDTENGSWERWDSLEKGRGGTQAFMCVGAVFITAGSSNNQGELAPTSLEMFAF